MSNSLANNNDSSQGLTSPNTPLLPQKKYKVKGTIKQRTTLKILAENGGSVSSAMRKAGYSPETAKTPHKLTESRGFEQLVEQYLPDRLLLRTHKSLLKAKRIRKTFKRGEMLEEIEEEDTFARATALKLGYMVKGKLINKTEIKGKLSLTSLVEDHG